MMEIFLIQLLAAALGAVSTASADWVYSGAWIGRRLHAFWVSTSIALICLPVVAWATTVFLGPGVFGQFAAGLVIGAIFLGIHQNLPNSRAVRKLAPGLPQGPSTGAVPPASRLNG